LFKANFNQKLFDLLQSLKDIVEESIRAKANISENIDEQLQQIKYQQKRIEEIMAIPSLTV